MREPHSKYLEDGIYELRTKQGSNISRILYFFFVDRRIVLTNGFVKKSMKTPKNAIELAVRYKNDYIERYTWYGNVRSIFRETIKKIRSLKKEWDELEDEYQIIRIL